MTTQPCTPEDIDIFEMSKLNDQIDWLVNFVNRKLAEGSRNLMLGRKHAVRFDYDDFVRSYSHLYYWRDYAEDIAAMFREMGWLVEVVEPKAYLPDEQQPQLLFQQAVME